MEEKNIYSAKRDIIGKIVVGKNTGKKIGIVKDIEFDKKTGELMYLILEELTPFAYELGITSTSGEYKISAISIDSIGDFIIVDETNINV